jgi:hypothetical protein
MSGTGFDVDRTGFVGSRGRSRERSCYSEGVLLFVFDRWDVSEVSCRRAALYQPTYSMTASSSWLRVRQTRSRVSSVLKLSTRSANPSSRRSRATSSTAAAGPTKAELRTAVFDYIECFYNRAPRCRGTQSPGLPTPSSKSSACGSRVRSTRSIRSCSSTPSSSRSEGMCESPFLARLAHPGWEWSTQQGGARDVHECLGGTGEVDFTRLARALITGSGERSKPCRAVRKNASGSSPTGCTGALGD